jgi:uracil-DNA glycosylase family 4
MDPKAPLAHCDECPLKDRPFVPGHGSNKEGIVIVGRDPGRTEVAQGKPFVGKSGVLLNEELRFNGIDRSSVYVTNAVLCHTEGNKKPSVRAVRACHDRLIWEIKQSRPRKVLALGETATGAVTGETRTIADLRLAGPLRSRFLGDDVAVGVTYHPGAILRNSNLRPLFASDIRMLLDP